MNAIAAKQPSRRVVLLTGASSEIGLECIRRFAPAENLLVAVTRDPKRFAQRLDELGIRKEGIEIVLADLADFSLAGTLLDEAIKKAGRIDVLVNAIGAFASVPALDVDSATLQSALDTNLVAPFVAMRAALPSMIEQRGGSIINIGSAFGLIAPLDVRCLAYGAAKAGLIHMTKLLAAEVGRYRVRVNCVCPGVLRPLGMTAHEDLRHLRDSGVLLDRQALPVFATAAEVAALVVHLASDEASTITGAVLSVDGGMAAL